MRLRLILRLRLPDDYTNKTNTIHQQLVNLIFMNVTRH